MSIFFDAREILKFAIRIEENGERFYRKVIQMTEDDDTREIFKHLAYEEIEHIKTFENLLSKIEEYRPLEKYPGEYSEYLRAYVDRIIFTDEVLGKETSRVSNTLSAADFGIQLELDSILYYHEVKKFVPESQHSLIDRIIDEERRHFSKLMELRKRYDRKAPGE